MQTTKIVGKRRKIRIEKHLIRCEKKNKDKKRRNYPSCAPYGKEKISGLCMCKIR